MPLYQAGGEFINSKCLQRDVLVEVEGLDKGDNFTGSLLVEGNNMAVQLTKLGFTSLHGPSADRSKYAEELRGAQQEAKAARIGVKPHHTLTFASLFAFPAWERPFMCVLPTTFHESRVRVRAGLEGLQGGRG